jgi:hypothetical protein
MAFLIFGPFADEKRRLDLLAIGPQPDDQKQSGSRRAFCKEEANDKDMNRFFNVDKHGNDAKRGISMATQINLATLEMKEKELEIRSKEVSNTEQETLLLNYNLQINNMYRMLDRCEARAKQFTTQYDENNFFWKKVIEQERLIDSIQQKINLLSEKKNEDDTWNNVPKKRKFEHLYSSSMTRFALVVYICFRIKSSEY